MKKNEIIKWAIVIILVVYMMFQLYATFSFKLTISGVSKNIDEIMAPYKVYEQQENRIEEMLTEDGYEVLYVGISNYSSNSNFVQNPEWYGFNDDFINTICNNSDESCWSEKVGVSVEMKSFGSRSEQIWDILTISNVIFPNVFIHSITIKSPTDKCEYTIFGVRQYFEDYDLEVRDLIQKQIDESGRCS